MGKIDKEQVIATWINNSMNAHANDEHFWAWELVHDAVDNDPEKGWDLIKDLVEKCPNDNVLADIAAGPLENLMKKYGETFIDRIETFANESEQFRKCLTGVWNISPWDINQRVMSLTQSVNDPL